tara:strand:+ start:999 stop:1139 length:141 start_codon:yes stop_codon:yes gene_type:complete
MISEYMKGEREENGEKGLEEEKQRGGGNGRWQLPQHRPLYIFRTSP